MEMLEQIKSKIQEINKQKEELVAQLRTDFAPALKPLFEKSDGEITSLGWVQYTPYFNDGDECIFSVNTDLDYGIRVNGEQLDDSEFFENSTYGLQKYLKKDGSYESWIEKYPEDTLNPETMEKELKNYSILLEFEELLESIDSKFFKDLFGDHVEVIINSDGTTIVNDYDHD
jgi:hypothetical protein